MLEACSISSGRARFWIGNKLVVPGKGRRSCDRKRRRHTFSRTSHLDVSRLSQLHDLRAGFQQYHIKVTNFSDYLHVLAYQTSTFSWTASVFTNLQAYRSGTRSHPPALPILPASQLLRNVFQANHCQHSIGIAYVV